MIVNFHYFYPKKEYIILSIHFFFESLNKIKELTKQEKIKTFQKEFIHKF